VSQGSVSFEACAGKCEGDERCTHFYWGWGCGLKDHYTCGQLGYCQTVAGACGALLNGPTDCGSSGNNGVHVYEYKRRVEATPIPTPHPTTPYPTPYPGQFNCHSYLARYPDLMDSDIGFDCEKAYGELYIVVLYSWQVYWQAGLAVR
jgi:hypothetical protein